MKHLLRHLELILTAAGLLVIFAVTAIFHPGAESPWTVAAITAVAVGVLHGVIFWLVRERQREVRRVALAETGRMLRDMVGNQLAVIRLSSDLQADPRGADVQLAVKRLETAIGSINETIGDISEESILRWRNRYEPPAPRR